MTSATDCPNCGAPKRGAVCEYCGTNFAHYQGQASVEIEPDMTTIYSWDGSTVSQIMIEKKSPAEAKGDCPVCKGWVDDRRGGMCVFSDDYWSPNCPYEKEFKL